MNLELKGLTDIYYVIKETAYEGTKYLMAHEKLHFQGWRLLSVFCTTFTQILSHTTNTEHPT